MDGVVSIVSCSRSWVMVTYEWLAHVCTA